jgi:hypothetical protein
MIPTVIPVREIPRYSQRLPIVLEKVHLHLIFGVPARLRILWNTCIQ